jgi:hypothetical protein
MSTYNGWTNYATWRVNMEIFDGMDVKEMGWHRMDAHDLARLIKEYANEIIESDAKEGLALDYARAFLSEVDWHEIAAHLIEYNKDEDEKPFHVIGIDEDDGNATILEQFDNSGEAREWMKRYVAKENAGGWNRIEVIDTRDECAETVWRWDAAA